MKNSFTTLLASFFAITFLFFTTSSKAQLFAPSFDFPQGGNSGSELYTKYQKIPESKSMAFVFDQISKGNIPEFLRETVAITSKDKLSDGKQHTVTFFVARDYLSLGTNQDFLRLPLDWSQLRKLYRDFHILIPSKKMVDLIHQQAVKVERIAQKAGPTMSSPNYFWLHNQKINALFLKRSLDVTSGLFSGHKKDLVISNRLLYNKNRIAIYGFQGTDPTPLQSLSTVHASTYFDYSHGVRMVHREALIDGKPADLTDLLQSPIYSRLLSSEGAINVESIYSK